MKLTIILLTAAIVQVSAKGLSQTVSFNGKNVPFQQVLSAVKKQTGFFVACNELLLDKAKPVTLNVTNIPLKDFLQEVFKNQPLDYSINNTTIAVFSKQDVSNDNISTINGGAFLPPVPIRGRVTDADGNPLSGASITVKNTKVSGVSNTEGVFTINASEGDVVQVSYIGYLSIAFKISTQPGGSIAALVVSSELSPSSSETGDKATGSNVNSLKVGSFITLGPNGFIITLKRNGSNLDEVVVNKGYYTESKRLATGNVSVVTAKDIQDQPVVNPLQALQGRMPGVEIVQASSIPGTAAIIQIRGQNSLRNSRTNNGNMPLFIIDGVPVDANPLSSQGLMTAGPGMDPLNTIDLSNIKSIEILKDADATSIYGSRGANGVVLVTTKRGKSGNEGVEISAYYGTGKVVDKIDLLNTQQYVDMRKRAFANDGVTPGIFNARDLVTWDTTRYTDWQKELLGGTTNTTDVQGSVSGGNLLTYFRLGGGFHKETTVFPGDFGYRKLTGHFSFNHSSKDQKFQASVSTNFGVDKNNLFSDNFIRNAIMLAPDAPKLYTENGDLNWQNGTWTNPMSRLKITQDFKSRNVIANAVLSYQLFPGLSLKASLGFTDLQSDELIKTPKSSYSPASQSYATSYTQFITTTRKTWIIEPQAVYHKKIKEGNLEVLVGTTFNSSVSDGLNLSGFGYVDESLMDQVGTADAIYGQPVVAVKYNYNAIFGRVAYNWKEKYVVNASGRRDGSSRFGADRRFSNFGAIGTAWIFSNEDYIRNKWSFLSFGKLRASYGTTGSDQIPDYGYFDTYQPTGYGGLYPTQLTNPLYTWESNRKLEGGIELGFVKDRVHISASWYRNRSSNQLVGYPLAATTGFTSILSNLGATVQNTGWEFILNTININSNKFNWSSDINLTFPRNKLIAFPNIEQTSYATVYAVGYPLNSAMLFKSNGVDPQTGLYTMVDVNNDGLYNYDDRKIIRNLGRKYYGGISNTVTYKNLELNFFIEFVKQDARNYLTQFQAPGFGPSYTGVGGNQPVEVINNWKQSGDITAVQKPTQSYGNFMSYNNAANSNLSISDASFIRLKTVSLSYRLQNALISRLRIKNCRVYVHAQNLFTISNYIGLDPQNPGQFESLPPLQMFTGGIQFGF